MITLFNNVERLYGQPVLSDNEKWYCPVCQKGYKQKKSLENHINKRNCHSYVDLFHDTVSERYMYDVYKEMIEDNMIPPSKGGVKGFRKSKYYKPIANLLIYWSRNNCDMDMLAMYVLYFNRKNHFNHTITLLNSIASDGFLREFRGYLMKNEHLIDSESFFNNYKERLQSDTTFMLRSLERGDIGLSYLLDDMREGMDAHLESMTNAELRRYSNILEKVGA